MSAETPTVVFDEEAILRIEKMVEEMAAMDLPPISPEDALFLRQAFGTIYN